MARHVATIVLLCATSLLRAQQPAESPYTLKQVGPNAWAAIDNSNAKAPAGANAGFVIGDDGVVVIDTFASADAATRLLAEGRRDSRDFAVRGSSCALAPSSPLR